MRSETTTNPERAADNVTTESVASRDGTTIGYRRLGQGPALVVVCGAMVSSKSHLKLAHALADDFTVYLPDRRGRGLSGPTGNDYHMQKEIEDLDAMLTTSGAHNVFGISSGGLISLQTSLAPPTIHKLALYEPALLVDDSAPGFSTTRLDHEIANGKVAAALVTGMKESKMGPPILNVLPRVLVERLTDLAMKSEEKKAAPDDVTMRMFAPTMRNDFQLIHEMQGALESFASIRADVLLLGGSKSPAYLKAALDSLTRVVPHATRIDLAGLDHGGATDRDGKPEAVARELRRFFT